MVSRFLKIISREFHGLHEAAYLLGAFAIASQLLALLRDRLLAYTFGAGRALDIYYAAFRLPDFIFVSIASLVSLSVLIPFLMAKFDRGFEEAKHFSSQIFSSFFLIIVVTAALAFGLTPRLLPRLFPQLLADPLYPTLVALTRLLLLSPIFLGASNFLASLTQIHKRFFIYALSPLLYNVGIIAGILWFYPRWGLLGLGGGVVLGALLHCLIQVPFLVSRGLFPRLTLALRWLDVRSVVLLSLPRTLALSANELAELILVSLAALLTAGSVSVFNLAYNLQSVPLSIIGVSYSLAAFPLLTRLFGNGEKDKFVTQMVSSARHIIFWTLPVVALFVVLRAQIVRVVLGAGRFDWADTRLTAAALALFVVSLVPQSLSLLFVRSYYARGRTRLPLLINGLTAVLVIVSSYLLYRLFESWPLWRYFLTTLLKVDEVTGAEVLSLPLGFSFGLGINLLLHWWFFHHDFPSFSLPVLRTGWHSLASAIIMGGASYLGLLVLSRVLNLVTFVSVFLQGLGAGLIGIAAGVLVLYLLGSHELQEVWRTLHHRIWGAPVVGPDVEMV